MIKLKEYYYDTDIYGGIIDNKITMEFVIKDDKRWSERKFKTLIEPLLKQTKEDEYCTDVMSEKQMREVHAENTQFRKDQDEIIKRIKILEKILEDRNEQIINLLKEYNDKDRGIRKLKQENGKQICQLVKERYERDRGKNTDIDRVRYATMRFIGGNEIPKVKQVITDNPPYTTVLFEDGTKKVVKAQFDEETKETFEKYKEILKKQIETNGTLMTPDGEELYDRDKGIMIALLERIYGKKEFYKIMGWEQNENNFLEIINSKRKKNGKNDKSK